MAELEEKKIQWIQYLVVLSDGIDDPRITVRKTEPPEGYYWDNKHGNVVALIKTAVGAALGKTLDDSIEGNLKPKG